MIQCIKNLTLMATRVHNIIGSTLRLVSQFTLEQFIADPVAYAKQFMTTLLLHTNENENTTVQCMNHLSH